MSVFRLSLPTPYPVGPMNAYLIKERPYTLVDPGPGSQEARRLLQDQIRDAGVRLEEIERVILTHSHSDHCGLAGWVREMSGAVIYAHTYEISKLGKDYDMWRRVDPFLRALGMEADVMEELHASADPLPKVVLESGDATGLWGGEIIKSGEDRLEVLHMPGHAVGHLCLLKTGTGDFFSGDFLLPDITPNPVMEPDPQNPGQRVKSLVQYLASLDVLAQVHVQKVWPGHGGPFAGTRMAVQRLRDHHEKRTGLLRELMPPQKWLTACQITNLLYPSLADFNVYLGLSEVVAHLDLLEDRGLVETRREEGIFFYRKKP